MFPWVATTTYAVRPLGQHYFYPLLCFRGLRQQRMQCGRWVSTVSTHYYVSVGCDNNVCSANCMISLIAHPEFADENVSKLADCGGVDDGKQRSSGGAVSWGCIRCTGVVALPSLNYNILHTGLASHLQLSQHAPTTLKTRTGLASHLQLSQHIAPTQILPRTYSSHYKQVQLPQYTRTAPTQVLPRTLKKIFWSN